eukprot:2367466-Pleurochrysis_carterae.AAC.1
MYTHAIRSSSSRLRFFEWRLRGWPAGVATLIGGGRVEVEASPPLSRRRRSMCSSQPEMQTLC